MLRSPFVSTEGVAKKGGRAFCQSLLTHSPGCIRMVGSATPNNGL